MEIIKNYTTKNPCYTNNKKISVKGIMIHSVGCPQPKASVFINQFNTQTVKKGVHAFIDGNTGNVYQTLPWNNRAWHCGSGKNGSANDTHISVEICEPNTIKYISGSSWIELKDGKNTKECVMKTYKSAVILFAKLCKDYNLNPLKDGVIISHYEGNKRGIASSHGDPNHIWNKFGLTMDKFRKDIYNEINKNNIIVGCNVKIKNGSKTYEGKKLSDFSYGRIYKVKSIKNDRVVITYNDVVIAGMKKSDLILV